MKYYIQACRSRVDFENKEYLPVFTKILYTAQQGIQRLQNVNGGILHNIHTKMTYVVNYNENQNDWLLDSIMKDEALFQSTLLEKYFANPDDCPLCSSAFIAGKKGDFSGNMCYRTVSCINCKVSWTEEFRLSNITIDNEHDTK